MNKNIMKKRKRRRRGFHSRIDKHWANVELQNDQRLFARGGESSLFKRRLSGGRRTHARAHSETSKVEAVARTHAQTQKQAK